MIIFGPTPSMLNTDFLMQNGVESLLIYNLTGYTNYPALNALVPSMDMLQLVNQDEKLFDMQYATYIMNNEFAFMEFMSIIFPIYSSNDSTSVFICTNESEMRDTIKESLIKLIQQRYGYNSNMINDPTDLYCACSGEFSIPGLYMMDEDYKRYLALGGIKISKEDMDCE